MLLAVMLTQTHAGELNIPSSTARFFRAAQIVVFGRHPKLTLARIAAVVVISLLISKYVLLGIRVTGISMLPTYKDRSINLVNRLAYLWHSPRRGDVVSIRFAEGSNVRLTYLKRVIGLPGETVAFVNGRVLINGEPLDEPYLKSPCDWDSDPVKLKSDECYVVGDNRTMPVEDHWHGKVRLHRIVGKVLL